MLYIFLRPVLLRPSLPAGPAETPAPCEVGKVCLKEAQDSRGTSSGAPEEDGVSEGGEVDEGGGMVQCCVRGR